MRSAASLPLLLLAALAACSAPDEHRHRSVFDSAGRVLALDFGGAAAARRGERLADLPAAFAREVQRVDRLAPPPLPLAREAARSEVLLQRASGLVSTEAARRPTLPAALVPPPRAFGQALADDLALLAELFGPRAVLPEIDDARHRTDPRDERPEATWWQRLRRRLWL